MAFDTITISLKGDAVPLEDFSKAIPYFKNLIKGLQEENAPDAEINWVVEDLKIGSTTVTCRGITLTTKDAPAVEQISDAYLEVGRKIRVGEILHNKRNVIDAVLNLRKLINGKVTSIIFETPKNEYIIKQQPIALPQKDILGTETFGGIKGRVETITRRNSLHFTVYDYNDDHPISCYLPFGSEEKLRDIWGKLVYVEGLIKRDEDTDSVITIRNISNIEPIQEADSAAWRMALGSIQ